MCSELCIAGVIPDKCRRLLLYFFVYDMGERSLAFFRSSPARLHRRPGGYEAFTLHVQGQRRGAEIWVRL